MKRSSEDILTELLVMQSQDGDVAAWRQLVGMWQKPLFRHALRLTGRHEPARDVTQEAWMAMVRGIKRLDDPARFRAWAFRIVSNKAADWVRKQARRQKLIDAAKEEAERGADELESNAESDVVSNLRSAIRKLPPDRRSLLSMFYIDGMSLNEIADVLRIPLGTVKSRMHSVRQELKSIVERNNDE
jgi:RNA polymerase sigma-70 factor (ECF subfamily)